MKKMLLSLFVFSSLLTKLSAQAPTLSADNSSPQLGDAYTTQAAFTIGMAAAPAGGIGQSWNYGSLIDSGIAVPFQVVLPSSTPYADSFASSNLSIKIGGDSVYSYFTSSSSAMVLNGAATSNGIIARYTPFRTFLPYPFTYNSTNNESVVLHITGYQYTPTGTESMLADGYGSLVLPGRTVNNVLRVRYTENLQGTFDSLGQPFTGSIQTVSYLYFTPGTHAPLLSDVTTQTTLTTSFLGFPISTTTRSRSISYLKTFVLPVTFRSVKAAWQNKEIAVQWNTQQETNTDHFTIQRSLTGRDFQNVTTVRAKGNSQGSAYVFSDNSFTGSNTPATVYYRIQSIDKNGRIILSDIASVRSNNKVAVTVYPNPASSFIRISDNTIGVADLIAIYDAKGSLVKQVRNYSINQPINIAALAKGNYMVKVTVASNTTSSTLIKQ